MVDGSDDVKTAPLRQDTQRSLSFLIAQRRAVDVVNDEVEVAGL